MSYTQKRKQVDLLQQKINAHGELNAEVKKKINYKFRLDWNYYSNSMEGNTLTMDETRSVMVGNLTVGGKPIKDVLEIKGHDDIINQILSIGKGETRLSETRIREIHKGIMHEEDETKKGKIGCWKTEPNYLYNYKNERFDFASPAEVPARMHDLLNKTNAAIDAIQQNKKDAPHPMDVALQFHLDYVIIHPFYDGNGRTARILTNLLLISFGYPPFWVKTNERAIYNQYIGDIQGYGGNPNLFFEFAADMILRSQQLVLDAAEGKNIEEPDDIDKEILQAKFALNAKSPLYARRFDPHAAGMFLNELVIPGLIYFYKKLASFDEEFLKVNHEVSMKVNEQGINVGIETNIDKLIKNLLVIYTERVNSETSSIEISLNKSFIGFKHHENAPYLSSLIMFKFLEFYFECSIVQNDQKPVKIAYNDKPDIHLIEIKCNEAIRTFLDVRKKYLNNVK